MNSALKTQTYVAKGSRPWFNDIGIIKVTKVDKSASG